MSTTVKLPEVKENPRFLTDQLITYIGNKRALLPFIGESVRRVRNRLGGQSISCFDVFSGSGVVARYFKQHASFIIANDLEEYSRVINSCYLSNKSNINEPHLEQLYKELCRKLEKEPLEPGIIADLYAPNHDDTIQKGERVFYTARNARFLDTARSLIKEIPPEFQHFFLGPLLAESSVHANTAGVFKGFYKNRHTGIGQYGGAKGDALTRIIGNIEIPYPIFSNFECEFLVTSGEALEIACSVPEVDLAYLDPPYNQHPYGSNYFMLNVLALYERPSIISPVSGIPADWNRSAYNRKKDAASEFEKLVESLKAKFLVVSFNSEGFISREQMEELLLRHGKLEVIETRYNTFRGSRNLGNRNIHVTEYLFILEKH